MKKPADNKKVDTKRGGKNDKPEPEEVEVGPHIFTTLTENVKKNIIDEKSIFQNN